MSLWKLPNLTNSLCVTNGIDSYWNVKPEILTFWCVSLTYDNGMLDSAVKCVGFNRLA